MRSHPQSNRKDTPHVHKVIRRVAAPLCLARTDLDLRRGE